MWREGLCDRQAQTFSQAWPKKEFNLQQPLGQSWRMSLLIPLSVLPLVLLPSLFPVSCQATLLAEPRKVLVVFLGAQSRVEVRT